MNSSFVFPSMPTAQQGSAAEIDPFLLQCLIGIFSLRFFLMHSRRVLDESNGLAVDFDFLCPLCLQNVNFGLIVPQFEDYNYKGI